MPPWLLATARVRQQGIVTVVLCLIMLGEQWCSIEVRKSPKTSAFGAVLSACRSRIHVIQIHESSRMAHCPRYCRIETDLVGLIRLANDSASMLIAFLLQCKSSFPCGLHAFHAPNVAELGGENETHGMLVGRK